MSRPKLAPYQVIEIRRRYVPGKLGFAQLAREYGVSIRAIADIVHYRSWKDVA